MNEKAKREKWESFLRKKFSLSECFIKYFFQFPLTVKYFDNQRLTIFNDTPETGHFLSYVYPYVLTCLHTMNVDTWK